MSNVKTVRVGQMPGRIEEFAVEVGSTITEVLAIAGLDASGFEVKVDGNKVTDLSQKVTASTNLILLAKQVKGNSRTVRIGQMPGRIEEFALSGNESFAEALAIAGLDPQGFEVKADGSKVNDLNAGIGNTRLILLAKQVKGN